MEGYEDQGFDDEDAIYAEEDRVNGITGRIIGCAITVSKELGPGYLESVYENALVLELRRAELEADPQQELVVLYKGEPVGDFRADVVVENVVLLELKAARAIEDVHIAQALNYLKTTGMRYALILNFGTPKLGIKRLRR